MSRFSFIPLQYEKLSEGLEREILLKNDTDDIYVLDDYKIPVSATSTVRDAVNNLRGEVTELFDKSNNILNEYNVEKNKLEDANKKLNSMSDKLGNDLLKRINGLEDYTIYLEGFYEEVSSSFDDILKQIEDIINNYYGDLDKTLEDVNNKYEENLEIFNKYEEDKRQYEEIISNMESEFDKIKEDLDKKLQEMGSGSGSYDGSINVDKSVVRQKTSWFRWLSNSDTIYPGNRRATSFDDGLEWGRYDDPNPLRPKYLVDTNVDDGPYDINDFMGTPEDENQYLIRWYWDGPIENSGFTSNTGHFNQYGKRVSCIYEKQFTESIKEDIHIDI